MPACRADDATAEDRAVAGNGIDRAFVTEMVPHHPSAVEMAVLAKPPQRPREACDAWIVAARAGIVRTRGADPSQPGTSRVYDRRCGCASVRRSPRRRSTASIAYTCKTSSIRSRRPGSHGRRSVRRSECSPPSTAVPSTATTWSSARPAESNPGRAQLGGGRRAARCRRRQAGCALVSGSVFER
jgi:hypothetical protein